MRALLAVILACVLSGAAFAQGTVQQSGAVTGGHLPMFTGNARVKDAGGPTALNGTPPNSTLPGTLPSGVAFVNGGQSLALYSGYATSAYSEFKFGFDANGDALITVDKVGGGTADCHIELNGTQFPCIGSGGLTPGGVLHDVQVNAGTTLGGVSPGTSGHVLLSDGTQWTSAFLPLGGSSGSVQFNNSGVLGGIAPGTSGNVLTSNGSSWVSSAPAGPIGAPHVATYALLTAASTVTYPNGVWRDDFASGNGAPPLFYSASNVACSLNSGNGDKGSQVKSSDGKCFLANFPAGGVDVREFGAVSSASSADNLTALQGASIAAHTANLPLIIAGGQLNTDVGFEIYYNQQAEMTNGTCLVAAQDGPVIGTRYEPGATLGEFNARYARITNACVKMNGHHGTAFINRGGLGVEVYGFRFGGVQGGSFSDPLTLQTVVTTSNASATFTDFSNGFPAVGQLVTDSFGCVQANSYIVSVIAGVATMNKATNGIGCGPGDTVTLTNRYPDAGLIWSAIDGAQGTYYGRIISPQSREWVVGQATAVSNAANSVITFDPTQWDYSGSSVPIAMTTNNVGTASWAGGIATYNLNTDHGLATGTIVCINGINPGAYNICGPLAAGSFGSVAKLDMRDDPGGYVAGGVAYYGGSWIENYSARERGDSVPAGVFVLNIAGGNTVTVNDNLSATYQAGDVFVFTTSGIGVLQTGDGRSTTTERPNVLTIEDGQIGGYAAGVLDYFGEALTVKRTDGTFNGWAVVVGGNGDGPAGHLVAEHFQIEQLYAEHQMSGSAVYLTTEAIDGCVGTCVRPFNSVSLLDTGAGYTGAGYVPILDFGQRNVGTGQQSYTPVIKCAAGSVAGYSSQTGKFTQGPGFTVVSIHMHASGAGTCAGAIDASLPNSANTSLTQTVGYVDPNNLNTISHAVIDASGSYAHLFKNGAAPGATDAIEITGVYQN